MGSSRERAIDAAETVAPFLGEFLGTFLVAVTFGFNALTGSVVLMPTSVSYAVMVGMCCMASDSGGHVNPAISLAFGLARKMGWLRVLGHCVAQLCGGLAGGSVVQVLIEKSLTVGPKNGYALLDAMITEVIFTTMTCFVALSCIASVRSNPRSEPNQYASMAVGFVAIAGGISAYEISGSYFNPALTVGFGLVGNRQPTTTLLYCCFQASSAILAATLFFMTRPEELAALGVAAAEGAQDAGCGRACGVVCPCVAARAGKSYTAASEQLAAEQTREETEAFDLRDYRAAVPVKLLSEFLGAFAVVATFGLSSACNKLLQRDAANEHINTTTLAPDAAMVLPVTSVPWATGAAVLSMGYALGNVSGGHFNPAITIGAVFSRRSSVVTYAEFLPTVAMQVGGAIVAALTFTCVNRGAGELTQSAIGPQMDSKWFLANFTEALFTAVVVFVALCATTVTAPKYSRSPSVHSFSFALAMGMAVAAAGFATESQTGGHLNPAITLGVASGNAVWQKTIFGDNLWNGLTYILWQCLGGVVAGLLFIIAHPMEYKRDPLLVN